jgi:hypothetical protein
MATPAAGYSGTPRWRKLAPAPGRRLLVRMAPPTFDELLAGAPEDITRLARLADFDLAIQFVTARAVLDRSLQLLLPHFHPHGVMWIAWPKKAAKMPTDVTEDVVREYALARGLVDVKVCAIDATWSGLKLMRQRTGWPGPRAVLVQCGTRLRPQVQDSSKSHPWRAFCNAAIG